MDVLVAFQLDNFLFQVLIHPCVYLMSILLSWRFFFTQVAGLECIVCTVAVLQFLANLELCSHRVRLIETLFPSCFWLIAPPFSLLFEKSGRGNVVFCTAIILRKVSPVQSFVLPDRYHWNIQKYTLCCFFGKHYASRCSVGAEVESQERILRNHKTVFTKWGGLISICSGLKLLQILI